MTLELTPHPSTPCRAVDRIEVDVSRLQRPLVLCFTLNGDLSDVKGLPATGTASTADRADELWRTTCLEAFVGPADASQYLELNLSPMGNWAAYQFSQYRKGMAPADIPAPKLRVATQPAALSLTAYVETPPDLPPSSPLRCGVSAVVQTQDGAISYWALAHPPGKPDFHHDAGFAHILAPAEVS